MQVDHHKAEIVSLEYERRRLLCLPTSTVGNALNPDMYMDVLTADLKSIDCLINAHTVDAYAHEIALTLI